MTSQEEWRQIAYQRWVGETGNNSMGTTWNNEGFQTYQARQAATDQFYRDVSRTLETPSWTPAPQARPLAPAAPQLPDTRGASPGAAPSSHRSLGGNSGSSGFLDRLGSIFEILEVSDAEDFWCASDWLFEPIGKVVPRWLVISICCVASALVTAAMLIDGQAGLQASLLLGAAGFFAPLLGYVVLRLAVSAATLAVALAIVLAFFGAAIAAAGVGVYGIFLLARAMFA